MSTLPVAVAGVWSPQQCIVCGADAHARGLCLPHHSEAVQERSELQPADAAPVCVCGREWYAKGLCSRCYQRVRRGGVPAEWGEPSVPVCVRGESSAVAVKKASAGVAAETAVVDADEVARVAAFAAPCRSDPDTWFSDDPLERRWAAEMCAACPVFNACRAAVDRLEAGVTNVASTRMQWGVWAAESKWQRLRRRTCVEV